MTDEGRVSGWLLLVLAVVAAGLALFAFDLPRPLDEGMAPALRKGDLVLACRFCGEPRAGDIVLFSTPETSGQLAMRRVVATPGDTITSRGGELLRNGAPLSHSVESPSASVVESLGTHRYRILPEPTPQPFRAPQAPLGDGYFLLADDRHSRDSRSFGPIDRSRIRSIVLRVLVAGDGDSSRQGRVP